MRARDGAAARGRERVSEPGARLVFGKHLAGGTPGAVVARAAARAGGAAMRRETPRAMRRRLARKLEPRRRAGIAAADYLAAVHCCARFLRLIFFVRRAAPRALGLPVRAGGREWALVSCLSRAKSRVMPGSRACIACRAVSASLFFFRIPAERAVPVSVCPFVHCRARC